MILAAGRGHEDIVRLLLDYGVPPGVEFVLPDGLDISPLSEAVRYGYLSLVKLFVSPGSDVHIGAWLGANILVTAARRGHYEVVRFLLEAHPDLQKSPHEASCALNWAARGGYLEIVELLLEHGMTPIPTIIEAAQVPEILELLLDYGADPGLNAEYGVEYSVEEVYYESVFVRALSTGSLAVAHILQ